MHNLLKDDSIVNSTRPWEEATLERANHVIQVGLESINQDLGDNFVEDITKTNGPEIFKSPRSINLTNEHHQSI